MYIHVYMYIHIYIYIIRSKPLFNSHTFATSPVISFLYCSMSQTKFVAVVSLLANASLLADYSNILDGAKLYDLNGDANSFRGVSPTLSMVPSSLISMVMPTLCVVCLRPCQWCQAL